LFVGIKPGKLYSASCVGREVTPLGVITHWHRHKPRACRGGIMEFFVAVKIMSGFLNCFRKLKQLMTAAQA